MIIQAVTGQSYETYIKEHIFQPLDMQNSFTSKTEAEQHGLAVGYQKWFGIPVVSPNLPFVAWFAPDGLSGSDRGGSRSLSDRAVEQWKLSGSICALPGRNCPTLHHPDIQMPGSTDYYAMGWEVQHFQDVKVIRHNGEVPGYTADMFLVPQNNLADCSW